MNPRGAIPVLQIGDEKLTESSAIIKYLLDSYDKEESLLPRTDRLARARVDEFIDYFLASVLPAFGKAVISLAFAPKFLGEDKPNEEETKATMDYLYQTFKNLDDHLEGRTYTAGENLTIADLLLYNELFHTLTFLDIDAEDYAHLSKWKNLVSEDPLIQETDKMFKEAWEEAQK